MEKIEADAQRVGISRRLLRAGPKNRSPLGGARVASARGFARAALAVAFGACIFSSVAGKPVFAEEPSGKRMSVPSEEQALTIEIGNLEARIREKPNDAEAWTQLASDYFKIGYFEKAAGAYRKLIEIKGETEEALLGLAEALIFGNNGNVSPAAKEAAKLAVAKNPKSGRGRLWLAIAAEQAGKKEEAQTAYRDMLNDDLTGSLRRMVTERLANLTTTLREAGVAHGTSGQAPKGHQGNIPEMVERLAERLKTSGGTIENWLMLIRSYYVLKEEAKAQEAVATAKQKFAGDPHALEMIDSLVKKVTSPEAKAEEEAAAKEAPADEKATPDVLPDTAVSPQIRGMVSRLAERLKDGGGDLEEWLQLIRSYAVLRENDKAQQAAANARVKFAADAKALEQIEALLKEVKLVPEEMKSGPSKS